MSKRFIVDNNNVLVERDRILIKGDEAHHINVLRHKVGDVIYINEYEVEITRLNKEIIEGIIVGKLTSKGVPNVNITLIQSYLKSDKMEYVVQKAVELGVKTIVPVTTKNTIVKMDEKDRAKKVDRLRKIAKEAIEQCGRTDEVFVRDIQDLNKVDLNGLDKLLICHEASNIRLKENLKDMQDVKNIAVVIGPEGGLDNVEVESLLKKAIATDVSLGERILRAETASLAIISILNYELNNM